MDIWKNCERKPITELLDFIVDNRGKTVPTAEKGHVLIATNCIKNDSLYPKYEKVRYLTEETYQNFFRAHPLPGDIIFVNKGTPGRVCLVPDPIDFCIAQDMIALRANSSMIDNHYLLAVLRSHEIQKLIYNTSVGDVIPHFKKQFMDRILIPIPPMDYQKRIGDLYFNMSSKIETNNKINAKLEEMAQALFKSWFVDFEPFKDKGMVESELGMIPEGWRVGTLGELVKTTSGGTPSRKNEDYYNNGFCCWVKSKELNGGYILDTEEKITSEAIKKSSAKLLPANSVLIAMYGATVGEFAIISKEMTCNQAICALLPNEKVPYTYLFMLAKNNKDRLVNSAVGSAQQNISQVIIKDMQIVCDEETVCNFHKKVAPIFEKLKINYKESSRLSHLRDTLLPKLMSGEIEL